MANILNPPQAEAVANAMAALNNVGAKINDEIVFNRALKIGFFRDGGFEVAVDGVCKEMYGTQAEFLAAYGID